MASPETKSYHQSRTAALCRSIIFPHAETPPTKYRARRTHFSAARCGRWMDRREGIAIAELTKQITETLTTAAPAVASASATRWPKHGPYQHKGTFTQTPPSPSRAAIIREHFCGVVSLSFTRAPDVPWSISRKLHCDG